MSENRYWAAFGLKEPKPEGGKEQELTDPAPSAVDKGGNEQEVAEPAEETAEDLSEQVEDPSTDTPPAEEGKKQQTAEERREAAAKRREQELTQYREQVIKEYNERLKAAAKGLKLRNGAGNAEIGTLEELEQLAQANADQKLQRDLAAGKLTKEGLEAAILGTPGVKQLMDDAKAQKAQAEAATAAAQQETYKAQMQQQLQEIRKINPGIKSIDDVIRMETGPQFAAYVRKGLEPVEAYRLANHDAIVSSARGAGEQAARNAAAGKSHLQPVQSSKTPQLEISEHTKAQYRRFIPGITDEQIAKYERNKKNE